MFGSLDRRQFLTATAAAGLVASTSIRSLFAATCEDRFQGWPLGAQSYSLRNFELIDAVRHLKGLGLHHVELFSKHLPVEAEGQHLQTILGVLQDADIHLVAHGVSSFTADHEANRKVFQFAQRAGIKTITANPEPDSFDSLDKLCPEYNVRIAIHNHGPGALYDKIDSVVKAVEGRHPLIGACVDTGHFLRTKENPVEAVQRLKGRVFALHVKDEARLEPDSHNVVIGTGHLDLVALFKALKETKFPVDGGLSLEYEANPEDPIEEMKACVEAAVEAIGKVGRFG